MINKITIALLIMSILFSCLAGGLFIYNLAIVSTTLRLQQEIGQDQLLQHRKDLLIITLAQVLTILINANELQLQQALDDNGRILAYLYWRLNNL